MQSFKTFLRESAPGTDLSQVHALLAGPIKNVSDARLELAREALKKLEAALASKTIWNADFTDIKDRLTRTLEHAYDGVRDSEYYGPMRLLGDNEAARRQFFADYEEPSTTLGLQGAKKNSAHWAKLRDKFPGLARVSASQLAVKNALDAVKPFIQKGRAPKPVDPNKFVKPMVPYEAKKLAISFLEEVIANVRAEYTQSVHAAFARDLEVAKALSPTSFRDLEKVTNPQVSRIAKRIWINAGPNKPMTLEPKAEALVQRMAQDQVDMVLGEFLHKNSEKLGLILGKKAAIKSHKILSNRVRAGSLENDMYFEFTDNSSFRINSKVEGAYSPRGIYFLRLPTRFTDVRMADGSKMSMPSEEKMIKEF